jgi:outer membrane protein
MTPNKLVRLIGAIALVSTLERSAVAQNASVELSLKAAVELAVKLNPRIQIANLRVLETESGARAVRSGFLPQVTAGLGTGSDTTNLRALGLNLPGVPDSVGPFQQFDVRPGVSQTLFDMSLRKSIAAAGERTREAHWTGVSLRESTILTVVRLYLDVLEAEARIESVRARLGTAGSLLKQVRNFVEAGTASRLDEARASLQLENEKRNLVEVEKDRDIKKLLLANVIGLEADRRLELTDRLQPPATQPVIDITVPDRPEMRAVDARLKAAIADWEKARAERYPTVGVAADYGRLANSLVNNVSTFSARLVVRLPIFEGGRIEADISSANARVKQVEQELRETRLRNEMDLRTAGIELAAAFESWQVATAASRSAETVLQLAQARFEGGFSTNIEVVIAQEAVASAQAVEIRCLHDWYMARARLAKAQGNIMALFD